MRRYVTALLIAGAIAAVGYISLDQLAPATSSAPSTTTAAPLTTSTTTTSTSRASAFDPAAKLQRDRDEAKAYINSPERLKRYDEQSLAGSKVAAGLLNGKFGTANRYGANKQLLTSDFIGWGAINATNGTAYAIVY